MTRKLPTPKREGWGPSGIISDEPIGLNDLPPEPHQRRERQPPKPPAAIESEVKVEDLPAYKEHKAELLKLERLEEKLQEAVDDRDREIQAEEENAAEAIDQLLAGKNAKARKSRVSDLREHVELIKRAIVIQQQRVDSAKRRIPLELTEVLRPRVLKAFRRIRDAIGPLAEAIEHERELLEFAERNDAGTKLHNNCVAYPDANPHETMRWLRGKEQELSQFLESKK